MNEHGLNIPLVVDLDGTLIKTDLLVESANELLVANPLNIFKLFAWLKHSKVTLKKHLAKLSQLDPIVLPYNQAVVAFLHQERSLGRTIILATASHRLLADRVAGHLDVFDEVLSTEGKINLKAKNKRDALVSRFGAKGFDYVGNDAADLVVWQSARKVYVVSSSAKFINRVKALVNIQNVFSSERLTPGLAFTRVLRPHQWIKNLLILVPLLASHQFGDGVSVFNAFLGFFIFGLTASSVYILNDLIDIADDRHHQRKRLRPFASGNLSLVTGWLAWPLLLLIAFFLASIFLSFSFVGVLCAYFLLTLAYSLQMKQIAMLDVLALAGLYTIRIIAGTAAIGASLSFWLLTFSMFIFLSLAFIKRFSELKSARHSGHEGNIRGRGYVHQDLELASSMGCSAGYLSVLILALYIQDPHTSELYAFPQAIWLACPMLLYWISRAWLIAHRGLMHDDPIVFAIKDRVSWIVGFSFLGLFVLAKVL